MSEIPNCFYRISIKALVLNEGRNKFLITKEEDGRWELPGGGLDHGVSPHTDLRREIAEEMGLDIVWIAEHPSYFLTTKASFKKDTWIANVIYETKLADLDFTPSEECVEIAFVNPEEADNLSLFSNVEELTKQFKPENHIV